MINHSIYGGIVQLSGNSVEIEVTNDDIKGESPRALLKVISIDGAVPGGPWPESKEWLPLDTPVEGSGKAIFDFQEYFDAAVKYSFTFPYGDAVAVKHPLRAFDLSLLAGCSYIDNDITHYTPDNPETNTYGTKMIFWQAVENAVPIRILKGGISQHQKSLYNEAGTNFYQDFIQGNKFLTNRPDNQKIAYDQPLRLWYIIPETEQVLRQLIVEYTDSTGAVTVLSEDITLDPDGEYEFILDPAKWGIPADAKQMSVYQSSGGVQVGEKRTFIFDSKYYENSTFFFFSNSKSGIDDFWMTGAIKTGLPIESKTGIQTLGRDAVTQNRGVVVTGKAGSRKWTIFLGNRLSVDDMEALQDLLYSKNVWIVWKGQTVPVNLEDGDFNLTDTMRDLLINDELELVFNEGHKNSYY